MRFHGPTRVACSALVSLAALSGCSGGDSKTSTASSADTTTTAAKAASVEPPTTLRTPGTLTLGTDFTYPPLEYIDGNKQAGFDVELANVLAGSMHLKVKMVDTRFASLIPGLEAKRFDAIESALYITAERAKQVDFVPYFTTGQAFVVKQGDKYQPQQPKDLCGKTVAVLQGALVEELANGEIKKSCGGDLKVRSFPTDTEAFQEVGAGRADTLFTDRAVAAFRVKQIPGARLSVSSKSALYPVPVGIAVRKGDTAMKQAFETALKAAEDSGELKRLLEKYSLSPSDPALVEKTAGAKQ